MNNSQLLYCTRFKTVGLELEMLLKPKIDEINLNSSGIEIRRTGAANEKALKPYERKL